MNNIKHKETISIDAQSIKYISGGNVVESEDFFLAVLINEQQQVVSREYSYIENLYDDHYIVGNTVQTIDRDKATPATITKLQSGVIRLTRDDSGKVIPYGEKIVVPFLYDRIMEANSNTIIATITSEVWTGYPRHTYIDLDLESINYGKQLLPVVLYSADWFDAEYEGFAKCNCYSSIRYIPRNCKPRQTVTPEDLLTETEVKHMLHGEPRVKMKRLTGGCKKAQVPKK